VASDWNTSFVLLREKIMQKKIQAGITILGLGPGGSELLTREAWDYLQNVKEIYLRTRHHPVLQGLPAGLKINSFDEIYEKSDDFDTVYETIIKQVIELGKRADGVTYAVPGHPLVAETTCVEIMRQARELDIPVRIIEGLSFLEPVFSALEIDPFTTLVLMDALDLTEKHIPDFPPSKSALLAQIYSREVASDVKLTLMATYPDEHPVKLVHAAGTVDQVVEEIPLYEIDRSKNLGLLSVLFIPPLGDGTSFEEFQEIISHLRAPDGCPWDKKQTHFSLRPYLLEETYEAIQALDMEDTDKMCEEFGDLLLQIVLHAQIASEEGEFTMADILRGINQKIVRRHPHVFGDVEVEGESDVLHNWEIIKAGEREAKNDTEGGILSGVPVALPALSQAQQIQERAARVGFDWSEIKPVMDKVMEEFEEVRQSVDPTERAKELGDLLFAVVNLSRWYKVDAESVLREGNLRFRGRFSYIEKRAGEMKRNLKDMTLAEMDILWEEAKKIEE
jgi:tetrapyrrole methylase family protein / MazG family protein